MQQIRPNATEYNRVLAHTQAYCIHILGQQKWGGAWGQFGALMDSILPSTHLGHTPEMTPECRMYNPKCAMKYSVAVLEGLQRYGRSGTAAALFPGWQDRGGRTAVLWPLWYGRSGMAAAVWPQP